VDGRRAVIGLSRGSDFWLAFPNFLEAPELEDVEEPLVAVVYEGIWPGPASGGPASSERWFPAPGTSDVCVEVVSGAADIGGSPFVVYANVDTRGPVLQGGSGSP
jgi:hypothetical protein